jgi:serine/threonine-protein kinase
MSQLNDAPGGSAGPDRDSLDRLASRFEAAWEQGPPPALDDFVPPDDRRALAELVHIDLERRLKAGEGVRVESYLQRYPALAEDAEGVLALLGAEYEQRRREPGLSPAEYCWRFPAHAVQLRQRLTQQPPAAGDVPAASASSSTQQTTLSPPAAGNGATSPPPPSCPEPRYRPLRFHARGALGEVLVAHDQEFHREVALKRIQEGRADDPESRRRFLLEAEITGRLEHPGVVPAYSLTWDEAGRPCYTMRLIQGDTLQQAIERFHQDNRPGRDPGERRLALRQLLQRFIAVCNTIAYAHSRGILHRDLKPANVMLGPYGETLVVDWGLAKAIDRGEQARASGEDTLAPTAGGEEGGTATGQLLGTPAYMSPEQAEGNWSGVGPASDIYGLGAILYCLLTGNSPFQGKVREVLERVKRGEFPPPRHWKKDIARPLEAVCLKAMARNPQGRYATAQELAADVEHWLADEPAAAYREPWPLRLGRWRRRHKALVAGVTAAGLALLVLGAIGVFWLVQQAAELRRGVAAALDRADRLQQQARWDEAEAVLEQAQDRLGDSGLTDLRQRVRQARADLGLVHQLDAARLKAATMVEGYLDYAEAERDYAAAFRQAQLGQPGDEVAAVAERLRASAIKQQLVAALDDWAYVTEAASRRAWLLAVARQVDPDPWRNRFRNLRLWRDRAALERLAQQAPVRLWSPQLVTALARVLAQRGGDAVPLLTAAQARTPQDFWLNFELGNALLARQRAGEAVGYYRAALALRPNTIAVYYNLGNALKDQGQLDEAIACYKKAMALDPKHALAHNNLGTALQAKGEVDRAIACYEKALALDPKLALAHNNLGSALQAKGQRDRAIACYLKALGIDPKFAKAHHNLGIALHDKGDLDRAIACYKKALALDPKDAKAHLSLGHALQAKGEVDRAIACYEKALALDPKLALAYNNLGVALKDKGQLDRAIACYKKALALDPKDARAHNNLGNALKAKGDLGGAIACYKKALALDPKDAKAHYNLGSALQAKGDLDGAIACYRQALALDPRLTLAHYNLGSALHAGGRLDGAIVAYRQAIALQPNYAEAHCNLGHTYRDKGAFRAALAALQRGHQLGTQQPHWRYPSARWVKEAERWVRLDRQLPAILKGQIKAAGAAEWIEYAQLCKYKKLFLTSARLFTEAFAADPKLADDLKTSNRYNAACYAALAATGKGQDAGQLAAPERARLRQQALAWLRADLALWTRALATGRAQARAAVQRQLRHWQRDPALAGIRDAAWLVNLPADDLRACRRLWADVDALFKRAGSPK